MTVSPDDVCQVCFMRREIHGDKLHKFSEDGNLEPLPSTPPKRRQEPPKEQGSKPDLEKPLLRLVSTLTSKGVLDAANLLYIFGATDGATDRGQSADGSTEDHNEASA